MAVVYLGNFALALLIIVYFSQCLSASSRLSLSLMAWIYYQANIRLACMLVIIGFIGLLMELRYTLQTIVSSSETQVAQL